MSRQHRKSLWQRADETLGFVHDERTERIQLLGARQVYFFALALFLVVALFQQLVNGQVAVFWVMLAAAGLSLLFLTLRRNQIGGKAPADERLEFLLDYSYRLAYFFLLLVLGVYLTLLVLNSARLTETNAIAGLFWWTPTICLTLLPLFKAHIRAKTYSPRTWRIVAIALLIAVSVGYLAGFLVSKWQVP